MSLFTLIAFSFLCVGVYYLCPLRFRWLVLLAASYVFYAHSAFSALPYIVITTLSTWAGALFIGRLAQRTKAMLREQKASLDQSAKKQIKAQTKRRQRLIFFAVLALNFALLAIFKYSDAVLGLLRKPSLGLLLPLGISFYTFQSMGYLIDVYNGKYEPQKNPVRFALYVSFFPQLIQGPIGRYDQLAPQLFEAHRFDIEQIEHGALLIAWGFFKKKVIADRALPLVEAVFSGQNAYGGAVIILGVLFYSLQQYCDFSGGIDIVTGVAQMMGIRLAPNFRRPYFSVSLGDFWRRWHISLGSWMRDYVFYPFALTRPMSRLSKALKKRVGTEVARAFPAAAGNILVFLLVGIWHGATANYVLWGLYNGIILAISALLEPAYKRFGEQHARLCAGRGFYLFRVLRTFLIVNIGWYFDRCVRAGDAFAMLGKSLFDPQTAQLRDGTLLCMGLTSRDFGILALATALLFAVSLAQERGIAVRSAILSRPLPIRWAVLLLFLLFIVATFTTAGSGGGFLYAVF